MAICRIDFTGGFAGHLAHLGVACGMTGTVDIDDRVMVETPVTLAGVNFWQAPAQIGAFSYFGPRCTFANAVIGRYCSVGEGVQIGMTRHPASFLTTSPIGYIGNFLNFERHLAEQAPDWQRALPIAAYDLRPETRIGNDVWIGTNAFLKDGITVGDGAVIGAHAVVTRDVPPYAIVAGSPARIIRYRFADALIERLLGVAWWRCNMLDLADIDMSDAEACVTALETRIGAGQISGYAPHMINLVEEYARFQEIQAFIAQRRA